MGLEAARCRAEPAFELSVPAITHHRLVLVTRPPEDLDLRYEGVKRHRPTPAGSISVVPAGSPVWARSSGHKDELHIFLQAALVTRVAAEAFDLDAARCATPPAGRLALPTTPGQRGSSDMKSGANSSAFSPKSAEKLAAGAPQKQKNQSFSPPSSRSGWAGGTP